MISMCSHTDMKAHVILVLIEQTDVVYSEGRELQTQDPGAPNSYPDNNIKEPGSSIQHLKGTQYIQLRSEFLVTCMKSMEITITKTVDTFILH